jgi:S1-C subfamily serine protease
MRKLIATAVALAVAASLSACNVTLDGTPHADTIEHVRKSTVRIVRDDQGYGSGFIVKRSGGTLVVITNHHVVHEAKALTLQFSDGYETAGKVLEVGNMELWHDYAIIEFRVRPNHWDYYLRFDCAGPRIGQKVWTFGHPRGMPWGAAFGYVEALDRNLGESLKGAIQHGMPIFSGNSGGPLLSISGRVVGVVAAMHIAAFGDQNTPLFTGHTFSVHAKVLCNALGVQ